MKRMVLGIICMLMAVGCTDKDGYDNLDGMWQLVDTSVYYSFQVDVVNIKETGKGSYYGYYRYENDSLYITIRDASIESVQACGLKDTIQTFEVVTLTKSKMVLDDGEDRLNFRKY